MYQMQWLKKVVRCYVQLSIKKFMKLFTKKERRNSWNWDYLTHPPIWHPCKFYPGPKLYQSTGFDIIFNSGSPVLDQLLQTRSTENEMNYPKNERNCKLNKQWSSATGRYNSNYSKQKYCSHIQLPACLPTLGFRSNSEGSRMENIRLTRRA